MGRSFKKRSPGVKCVADRWSRSSRALKKEDQQYGERLVGLAKKHSSEAFVACDDPLKVAVFSALVETIKHQNRIESLLREDVDH